MANDLLFTIVLFMSVSSSDHTNLVTMMDPSALDHTSKFLFDLTSGGQDFGQYNCNLLGCPTPPDSVSSANTPSPSRFIYSPTPSVPQEDNFNCTPIMTSSPGPSSAAMVMPCRYPPSGSYQLSSSLPVGRAEVARRAISRPQLTSAHYNGASIKILNPKQEYYKVQKKHEPRKRYSEQRISNGQVRLISACSFGRKFVPKLPLSQPPPSPVKGTNRNPVSEGVRLRSRRNECRFRCRRFIEDREVFLPS